MLPAIGSISVLPSHGQTGVVMDARALGDPEGGRQLVAVKIKAEAKDDDQTKQLANPNNSLSDRSSATNVSAPGPASATIGPTISRRLDQLGAAERADIAKLQQRDQQVRQEEKAHAAVAGDLAGPINYVYQRGPDGRQYAVGGSVSVQAKTVSGDPNEAKRQSGRMAAAAHAATSPSAQDLATARLAYDFANRSSAHETKTTNGSKVNLSL